MKVILNHHISGPKGSFSKGDTVDVDNATALRYIDKGIATPKNKKEYDSAVEKEKKRLEIEAQKERELQALLLKEELLKERESILKRVEEIDEILGDKEE